MAKVHKIALLLVIFVSSLLLRFYLSPLSITGDLLVHADWSKMLRSHGLANSYFIQGWLYTPPTQPPLMMLSFWVSQWLYDNHHVVAQLHNLIRLPPTSQVIWFDQNGQYFLLRLWAIIGDYLSASIVYLLFSRFLHRPRLAIFSFLLLSFHPISLFISSIWGQNDTVSAAFALFAFFILLKPKYALLSPILYIISLSFKPTTLVLAPLYFLYILKYRRLNYQLILGIFFAFLLFIVQFKPFIRPGYDYFGTINDIVVNRIAPSSKGITRASNSAFNLYSLVYEIDRTPGQQPILFTNLDTLSHIIYLILVILSAIYILKSKPKNNHERLIVISFSLFFLSQGAFLFTTSMLERYFFPALVPCLILILLLPQTKLRMLLVLQQLLWFLNITYSYFQRDIGLIRDICHSYNYFPIRVMSLLSIIIFIYVSYQIFVYQHRR